MFGDPLELAVGGRLAEAMVGIVREVFVRVVVAVLSGVHHQRAIQVGFHVWAHVRGEVDLEWHIRGDKGTKT